MENSKKIKKLMSKGVEIPNPESVQIGSEVDLSKISSNRVVIYSGCKIFGSSTIISDGASLGYENPVTIKDCKMDINVQLKGGYFENSIFLEESSSGSGSHIRSGCILEEYVKLGNNVGLKKSILFPFLRIGSMVNFCDCFMFGGMSNTNHSEVGSFYVHFNYTPNQDKATPSLIGDVVHGVMLNQKPIFLGGQGGLVGPSRINYGTVIAAGSIYRKDQLKKDRLVFDTPKRSGEVKYSVGIYNGVNRQTVNNMVFLANLMALYCWYKNIRVLFASDFYSRLIYEAALEIIDFNIVERINKFESFCKKLIKSSEATKNNVNYDPISVQQKKELFDNSCLLKNVISEFLNETSFGKKFDTNFLSSFIEKTDTNRTKYIDVIKSLDLHLIQSGIFWLEKIANGAIDKMLALFPSIKYGG